jgi:phenylpropionate dioxygenase-like ring-hydroxylating dioxygenase large terminal subunit
LNASNIEAALWDDWHVVAEIGEVRRIGRYPTALFGTPLTVACGGAGQDTVAFTDAGSSLPVRLDYGFVWVCLGSPAQDIPEFAALGEPDRWIISNGPIAVAVSGLRAVENFLDMGHFAFVHTGYLGEEPHTEIKTYTVRPRPGGGIVATECKAWQPRASLAATEGFEVDYIYEVVRPYTVLLYKVNPVQPTRWDMIVLFLQPVSEERCVAHLLSAFLKDGLDEASVRRFGQLIFCQDKPILENQLPKRLPLGPATEIPVRADAASAAYRRYLRDTGIRYGAIPADA